MHIVEQTNLYVRQKHAASYKWKDLMVPQLKAFFGVWIYMGIIRKPATRDYWAQGLIIEGEFPNHTLANVHQELGGTYSCSSFFGFIHHKCIHSGICKPKPCPAYS